jgi:hypothetical protein
LYRRPYRLQHSLRPKKNIVVPEAQHPEAARAEQFAAPTVRPSLLLVLPAIDFDDQAGFEAYEVNDVLANRSLPAKFRTHPPARAQVVPQTMLGIGRLRPQVACKSLQRIGGLHHAMLGAKRAVDQRWPRQ